MNIQTLLRKAELAEELLINSGFKRDIQEYINSIQNNQQTRSDLIALKNIAQTVVDKLESLYEQELPEALNILLPKEDNKPLTNYDHIEKFKLILDDPKINANTFYSQLQGALNELKNQIEKNLTHINKFKDAIEPYGNKEQTELEEAKDAIISLIFKDEQTTGSFKKFARGLNKWDRALHLYHQLLVSEGPEEIKLLGIQNGSIDVIFNINADIAIDLVELIALGLKVYGGYLLYKSRMAEIVITYYGNKKLEKLEREREQAMLENIGEAIKTKLLEQHEEKKEIDPKISNEAVDKKVEEVAKVFTSHIIKGNEIKLIAAPKTDKKINEEYSELEREAVKVRRNFKKLAEKDKIKLLEQYSDTNEEDEKLSDNKIKNKK